MNRFSGKPKKCASCRQLFTPERPMQNTCCGTCALAWVNAHQAKKHRAETVRRKKALLDNCPKHWAKKAKDACHAYIRERDRDLPCVSCGRFHDGQYHAGHYRPSGVNSALRYDERNIHKQCAPCNNHKSGNIGEYRKMLVLRFGDDLVEWLDDNHEVKRWTVDDLKAVHAYYTDKLSGIIEARKPEV